MDEQILRLIFRLKSSQDGIDFLNFLEQLSKENYEEFKRASSDRNDIYKGRALALDALIKLFNEVDEKLNTKDFSNISWSF